MRTKYFFFSFVISTFICLQLQADTSLDLARFEVWFQILEKPLATSNQPEAALDALLNEPRSRIASFNLQALGRLYEGLSPSFSTFRSDFKFLEDGLGQIDKWKTLKNNKNLKAARQKFASDLKTFKWIGKGQSPQLKKNRNLIKKILKNQDETRGALLQQLINQLTQIQENEFDLSQLEEGNGLHELRRKIRWFMIEAQVLNGLIQFKASNSCPITAFRQLMQQPIAQSKYAVLNENPDENQLCRITSCYFVGLAQAVEDFGQLKDQAEGLIGNTKSDQTPDALREQAEVFYQSLIETNVFPKLSSEIKKCL
jgi:hypothetical protein